VTKGLEVGRKWCIGWPGQEVHGESVRWAFLWDEKWVHQVREVVTANMTGKQPWQKSQSSIHCGSWELQI
jgi:hypothetical protein